MSGVIEAAVAALAEKLGAGFDGSAKFVIAGEGAVVIDAEGVRSGSEDEETDVTLSAESDTFQGILSGDLNPTSAFMSGKLKVDGDMGAAMKLGGLLG